MPPFWLTGKGAYFFLYNRKLRSCYIEKLRRDVQLAEKKFAALQHCVREEFVSEFFNNQENNSVHSSYKSLLCNYSEPCKL